MTTKVTRQDPVNLIRDRLVTRLSKRGTVRDDLWMKNVWADFSHMVAVFHMQSAVNNIAEHLPVELKRAA
ncbi:hypothetical protein [Rhodoferax fermentans]|uniref:Uncharacterized protein n=1 Tax=Rhodoferax fermentans TaxID=28066 RepID=A0A1T1APE1_RHOFE|nr:hypothetical protein [Rhodoferax fermentans]MBK1683460.1 hypothetical protein [Rhodoferax fermentans]OOV05798.1 hypothetical protein RF819_02905 [Rhodoferax fermentans]